MLSIQNVVDRMFPLPTAGGPAAQRRHGEALGAAYRQFRRAYPAFETTVALDRSSRPDRPRPFTGTHVPSVRPGGSS